MRLREIFYETTKERKKYKYVLCSVYFIKCTDLNIHGSHREKVNCHITQVKVTIFVEKHLWK